MRYKEHVYFASNAHAGLITSSTHSVRCNSNHSSDNRQASGKQSNGAIADSCLLLYRIVYMCS